jgi:hypothetical protein
MRVGACGIEVPARAFFPAPAHSATPHHFNRPIFFFSRVAGFACQLHMNKHK